MIKRFAIMGVGGYVAPRHLKAIHDLGHDLVAAQDIHDSVGILDSYFPECSFFTQFERFERFLEKEGRENRPIDYLVVCTPNYLHDSHCRFGLRMGMNVICEKPLVLNPWNVSALVKAEKTWNKQIANILQLRLHPELLALKKKIDLSDDYNQVQLTYWTPRGPWYDVSWKGDATKSGGMITNIGIHLFDILIWIFGPVISIGELEHDQKTAKGVLHLQKAHVTWQLSTAFDKDIQPMNAQRIIEVNGSAIAFDKGFTDLHTKCYEQILNGNIVSCTDLQPLIQLMWELRQKSSTH